MLKELLLNDFKIDLPISGGTGQSINDSIVINTPLKDVASRVEMDVIRCINLKLGRHWRLIGKQHISNTHQTQIEKVRYESKYVEDDQVITETLNMYFDVTSLELSVDEITPNCYVSVGNDARFCMPYQLGWLNFSSSTDNEQVQRGAGLTVAYGAPGTKATIFIYNKSLDMIDPVLTPELFEDEFNAAVHDILSMNPNAETLNAVQKDSYKFQAFDIASDYSAVLIGIKDNHFLKTRVTLANTNDKYVFDCMMQSLSAVIELINN